MAVQRSKRLNQVFLCRSSAHAYAVCLLVCGFAVSAQTSPTARPPRDWAVQTAGNEVAVLQHANSYLRYRMHLVDEKGDQIRDVIESKDGTVARLISRDSHSLTPEEDAAERQRLKDVLASPEAYFKHIKSEESGKKTAAEMVRQMPDAMIYTYTPGQPQIGSGEGEGEVVLDYHPNPQWNPPTTTAAALTGLQGRMWIDVKTGELLRMTGEIFKPVNFGWGVLAHIYPGGKLLLEQTDAGGQRWIYTHFDQQVNVRALMVKTLNVHTEVDASQFQVLSEPMSYQQAIHLLLDTPLPQK